VRPAGGGVVSDAIRYDTTSPVLADGIVSLLLRFGITARVRPVSMGDKGRPSHRLDITGQLDQLRFALGIGAVGARRTRDIAAMRTACESRVGCTNRDVLPAEVWDSVVADAQTAVGMTDRELRRVLRKSYGGPKRSNMTRPRALTVAEVVKSSELRSLAQSDVYWDEIDAIELSGESDVFDLTVDGLHNFVSEDIIVHNSIEQDADLVFFVYRDEYYNPEDTESQGLAELILAKHRNGPTDAVKLSFLKRYAKFADLAGG
jgi:replicative DNA helicase